MLFAASIVITECYASMLSMSSCTAMTCTMLVLLTLLTLSVSLYAVTVEAEAAYNLGRAAHQVGLLHLAVAHYERVLQIDQEAKAVEQAAAATQQLHKLHIQQQQQQEADGMQLDGIEDHQKQQQHQKHQHGKQQQQLQYMGRQLVREAAHNLCLIYKGSGADDLARQIMRRYLTV